VNVRKSPEFNLKRQLGGIRLEVPEYSIFCYSYGCGGGNGDPLDRDPDKVCEDISKEVTTPEMAAKVYGVVIDVECLEIDHDKTQKLRGTLLRERIKKAQPVTPGIEANKIDASKRGKRLKRITEYLEILEKTDGQKVICCMKCGNQFCSAQDNYKKYALRSVRDPRELKSVADCDETLTYYREYICPGCGTLLQVEAWCPMLDSEEPFWDIDVKV
jgi:hypothetical protein